MDEIIKLQDEILSYLRNNITKDEAYYILTPHMMEYIIKMADKSDGTVYRNRHSSAGNRNHWYCADLQMPA